MGREGLELRDCASLLSLRGIRHLGSGALPLCLLFLLCFPSAFLAPRSLPPPSSPLAAPALLHGVLLFFVVKQFLRLLLVPLVAPPLQIQ